MYSLTRTRAFNTVRCGRATCVKLSRYFRLNYFGKYGFFRYLIAISMCARARAHSSRSKLFTLTGLLFIVARHIVPLYLQTQVNVRGHATNGELL